MAGTPQEPLRWCDVCQRDVPKSELRSDVCLPCWEEHIAELEAEDGEETY